MGSNSRNLSRYVNVVDLETTCWEPPEVQGNEQQDIIEIGIAVFDCVLLETVIARSIMCMPARSTISHFCTRLTTIRPEDVTRERGALSFAEALCELRAFEPNDRMWISYGDFDRKMFERQCTDLGLKYPFGPRHLNIKSLLAHLYGWEKEYGMAHALQACGIPLEGTHHRGIDDAKNIAKLYAHVIKTFRANSHA